MIVAIKDIKLTLIRVDDNSFYLEFLGTRLGKNFTLHNHESIDIDITNLNIDVHSDSTIDKIKKLICT